MANIEEKNVKIVSWPLQSAIMEHAFTLEEPCPVNVTFGEKPVKANISTQDQQELAVNMNMNVSADEPVPFCIKLCQPICVQSTYTIRIVLFDQPVATITIRGLTKLFNSQEEI